MPVHPNLSVKPLLSRPDVVLLAEGWIRVELPADTVVHEEGQPADSLALVAEGRLRASVAGRQLDALHGPDLIGEGALCEVGSLRLATTTTSTPCTLWVLHREALEALADADSPTWQQLLTLGLDRMGRRLQRSDAVAGAMHLGEPVPSAPGTPFSRLWKRIRPTQPPAEQPDAGPALGRLMAASAGSADSLSGAGRLHWVEEGSLLFREGDLADSVAVVVSGAFAVERHTVENRALRLAQVRAGTLLGTDPTLGYRKRAASVRALSDGWVWILDARGYASLAPETRDSLTRPWLSTLHQQLHRANATIRSTEERAVRAS